MGVEFEEYRSEDIEVREVIKDFEVEVTKPKITRIPEGEYKAKLKDIRVIDTKYGKAFRWIFEVEYNGEKVEVGGITTTRFCPGSKAYRWFNVLTGKEPQIGEKVNLLEAIDCECIVVVRDRPGRNMTFSNVVDIKPAEEEEEEEEEEEIEVEVEEEEEEEEEKEEEKSKKKGRRKRRKR